MKVPTSTELREARKRRGLSQGDVADRAGVSQPLLSRVENEDVDPRLSTLHRIAAAINEQDPIMDDETLEVVVREAVKDQRRAEGLTQRELAEKAGVSQPMIARIENEDVDPRTSTFRAIIDVFEGFPGIKESGEDEDQQSVSIEESPTSDQDILKQIEASFQGL